MVSVCVANVISIHLLPPVPADTAPLCVVLTAIRHETGPTLRALRLLQRFLTLTHTNIYETYENINVTQNQKRTPLSGTPKAWCTGQQGCCRYSTKVCGDFVFAMYAVVAALVSQVWGESAHGIA